MRALSAVAAAAAVIGVGLGLPATARASVPDLFGFGGRSMAMAGTGSASAVGYEAIYANPSGLVEDAPRRLSIGYLHAEPRLRLDGVARAVESTDGLLVGAAVPLPFGGALAGRLALGVAFYFPTSVLNRARVPYPSEARLPLLDVRTQIVSAMAGIAGRVHPRLRIGAGLLVLASLTGDVLIAPDASGRLTTLLEEQVLVAYAPLVGLRVTLPAHLRVGATFRGESKASYDLRIRANLGQTVPIALPLLHIAGVAQYDPMQAALEAAWRPLPSLELDAGLTWKRWSAFPLPSQNASAGAAAQPAPGFHDTVVPRLALEYVATVRSLSVGARAGYFFEWSPAPASATTALVDADRHVVTAGATLAWRHRYGTLGAELFGQWHQLAGASSAGRADGSLLVVGASIGEDL